jgi:flagellar basal-body rod modification protein FlgD
MNIQGLPSMTHGLAMASSSSTGAGGSASPSATSNSNSAENAFIQLLVTELKSQDPTSPMDPTAMVGQMFSMNQLQQLIDINQKLGLVLGTSPSSSAASSASVAPSNLATSILQAATLHPAAAVSDAQQLLKGAK